MRECGKFADLHIGAAGETQLLRVPALLAAVAGRDFHPPLFYLFTHVLMVSVPKPQWEYRAVTAAFGCLTIVATWGAARRMFGPVAAAVAALAVAFVPALVQYDRIYRMYAVTGALSSLSFWVLLEMERAVGSRRRWLAVVYGALVVALPYVDYLGALAVIAQAAYALTRRPVLLRVLACVALSAIAFVPWLGSLREQLPLAGMTIDRPGLDAGLLASIQGAFAAGVPPGWLGWPGGALMPALVLALVTIAGAWLGRRSALPFWLGMVWVQIVGSLVLGKNLAYFPRYLLIDVPPVCIAAGLIISQLLDARQLVAAGLAATAMFAFFAVTVSNVLFDPYYQFPDWYAVNAVMLASEQPSDAVVLDAGYEFLVVRDFTAFRGREILSFMNPGDFSPILGWIARHPGRRVWYVEHQNFYWDPQRRIASALAAHRRTLRDQHWPRRWPVDDVSMMLFDKVPMTVR
jgi:hypothetical protein